MGAEETKEKLLKLKTITAEQQERGAEKLNYEGTSADGTIEGVIDEIKGSFSIENAVILSEDQAAYILHEYSEISYVSGQRAIWSTIGSSVVCQGIVVSDSYALGFIANKPTLEEAFPNGQPAFFTSGTITTVASETADPVTTVWELYLDSYSQERYYYYIRYSKDGGATWYTYSERIISRRTPCRGIYFTFGNITPTADSSRPYGYINVTPHVVYQDSISEDYDWRSTPLNFIPSQYMTFASEAERNAAIALRYEPQMLTEVVEIKTITG